MNLSPTKDCPLCPRLVEYRLGNRARNPSGHNAPVPSFGDLSAALLVVGQAPGVNGANRTGRPFTGDDAGQLLYSTLLKFGFARGVYAGRADDGFTLVNCRITNAVRCAPPQHKLTTSDQNNCRPFLISELAQMPNLRAILAIGKVAHDLVLQTMQIRPSAFEFRHGQLHQLRPGLALADSYHTSRYNVNTKRITLEMFEAVISKIRTIIL